MFVNYPVIVLENSPDLSLVTKYPISNIYRFIKRILHKGEQRLSTVTKAYRSSRQSIK